MKLNKGLSLLSLATRAGKTKSGNFQTEQAVKSGIDIKSETQAIESGELPANYMDMPMEEGVFESDIYEDDVYEDDVYEDDAYEDGIDEEESYGDESDE